MAAQSRRGSVGVDTILKLLVAVCYWPASIVVSTIPIWLMIALEFNGIDATSWLLGFLAAMIVVFVFMNATWDHAVRPWLDR